MPISIRTKVVFPVILLSLMMGGLVLAAWYALNETTRLNANLAGRFHEIEEVRQIEVLFSELIYPHLDYITTYSPEAREKAHNILHKIGHIVDTLNSMEVVNEEEREITELITKQTREIRKISEQILHGGAGHEGHEVSMQHEDSAQPQHTPADHESPMSQMGDNDHQAHGQHARDMALINQISQAHIAKVRDALRDWHMDEAEEVDALSEETRAQLAEFTNWMAAFAIAAVVMFLFSVWLNNRVLIRPVVSLSRSTNLFASGDLKQKAPIYAEDELGHLARDINKMATSLDHLYSQLATLAKTDQLTGLMNRHGFEEIQAREISSAKRYGHALSLAIFDIDHFKKVNDTYGHDVGDEVIRAIADCCRRVFRDCDYSFRYGGEEFIVLIPQTDVKASMEAVERLRKEVEAMVVKASGGRTIKVTISIGLAAYHKDDETGKRLLKEADEALYNAKGAGRNRSMIFSGI
jgi:diguanylate cyclase (GGDEF)-like protein